MTLRDDAKEARRFAYGDVAAAFRQYLTAYNQGRPFVVVGVEQGRPWRRGCWRRSRLIRN